MQTKSFFKTIKVFAMLAVSALLMTSCYKSESGEVPVLPKPTYMVCGNLFSASTGAPVDGQVSIKGGNYATTANASDGFFSVTVPDPMAYTITVDLDGYAVATRTVVVPKVGYGETGIGRADIMLFSMDALVNSAAVYITTSTPAEMQTMFDAIDLTIDDASALDTGANFEESSLTANADGTFTAEFVYSFDEPNADDEVLVNYPLFSGFETGVKPTDTKSILAGELWLTIAIQKLNLAYGMEVSLQPFAFEGLEGYSIDGYKVVYTFVGKTIKVEDCDGNGNAKSGVVVYMENVSLIPTMQSHSHSHSHSHDHGHGDDLGAGGGAGYIY